MKLSKPLLQTIFIFLVLGIGFVSFPRIGRAAPQADLEIYTYWWAPPSGDIPKGTVYTFYFKVSNNGPDAGWYVASGEVWAGGVRIETLAATTPMYIAKDEVQGGPSIFGYAFSWDTSKPEYLVGSAYELRMVLTPWYDTSDPNVSNNVKTKIKAITPAGSAVGGVLISVDKLALLTPYISLTSTFIVATVAIVIYFKRVKHRKEKQ